MEQARQLAVAVIAQLNSGNNPFERLPPPAVLTVRDAFEEYMTKHIEPKRKQPKVTRTEFERDCLIFAGRALGSVSHTEATDWHNTLGRRSQYVANRRLQLMRAVYNKMLAWKLYDGHNPFTGIALFSESPREYVLDELEFQRLWRVLEAQAEELHRDYFRLALLTGVRKGQLCRMSWADVDLENAIWTVPASKHERGRKLPLDTEAVQILSQKRPESEWVFPSPFDASKPVTTLQKAWERIREEAGLPECHFHDLRATVTTFLFKQTDNPKLVQTAMGHLDGKTTMRVYNRVKGTEGVRQLFSTTFAQVLPSRS